MTLTLLLIAFASGGALAECSPGQMQEAQIQFQSAQQLLQTQQWQQAIPQLNSIVDFCEEFYWAYRGLGMAHLALNEFTEAEAAYQRVVDVRGSEAEAADYANLAKALAKQKKYKEARAEYIKAKARDAKNQAVLVNLGILHYASGFPEDAVATLEDALSYYPEQEKAILPHLAKACTMSAERQKKLGNAERAAEYQRKASQYGGAAGGSTAYKEIQKQFKARNWPQVVSLCDQLLAQEPHHVGALLTKARAADQAGNATASIDAYQKYLAERPDNMDETTALVIVMAENNRCGEAETTARDALARFAGTGRKALGKIHFGLGKALFCAKDYAGAKAQFMQAANSGDSHWAQPAQQGISACDEYLNYETQKAKKAAQQGR